MKLLRTMPPRLDFSALFPIMNPAAMPGFLCPDGYQQPDPALARAIQALTGVAKPEPINKIKG